MRLYAGLSAVLDLEVDIEDMLGRAPPRVARKAVRLVRNGSVSSYRKLKRLAKSADRTTRKALKGVTKQIRS